MKKIAIYTSGGDCPGMNAAVRACTRIGLSKGIKILGIIEGYKGMSQEQFIELEAHSVANMIQRGGTFLKTARFPEFQQQETRKAVMDILKKHEIEGLICIGGDGSFQGAHALYKEFQFPIIGIPATIDNDIYGVDKCIGYDTAVNTALEAIDKIRDTAASHNRLFIVEVMGRNSGFIALAVGLAGGAEEVFTSESPVSLDETIDRLKKSKERGKLSSILITAEGQKPGRAYDLAEQLRLKAGFDARVCILGHIQRGGSPLASDRILASKYAQVAMENLLQGESGKYVAYQSGVFKTYALTDSVEKKKSFPKDFLELIRTLSL